MKNLIIFSAILLVGCSEDPCKGYEYDICIEGVPYERVDSGDDFEVYMQVDEQDDFYLEENHVFYVANGTFYYSTEPVEVDYLIEYKDNYYNLEDAPLPVIQNINIVDVEQTNYLLCSFSNINVDCYNGLVLKKMWRGFKFYAPEGEILTNMEYVTIFSNDGKEVRMDSVVHRYTKVTVDGEYVDFVTLYKEYGYEVFNKLEIELSADTNV